MTLVGTRIENERYGIAPSLAFGLDTPTRLYLNYLHVRQNNHPPDGGIPTVGLPGYSAPSPKYAALNSRREGRYPKQFLWHRLRLR
ncbi:ferrichrome-iron receptor [Klebsiella pneumoniae subsp. ozaenae]|uniref:Ferrichrome-iron receptor n=1 Tax=Klebsiella pneumoniae subsp. ozaenae TaxID=574 RepID=A0A377ZEZ1_KLEPO|nr:ferrichrome-iron receptor [Klebsiella pneumoniae subsp. ozaenae]